MIWVYIWNNCKLSLLFATILHTLRLILTKYYVELLLALLSFFGNFCHGLLVHREGIHHAHDRPDSRLNGSHQRGVFPGLKPKGLDQRPRGGVKANCTWNIDCIIVLCMFRHLLQSLSDYYTMCGPCVAMCTILGMNLNCLYAEPGGLNPGHRGDRRGC